MDYLKANPCGLRYGRDYSAKWLNAKTRTWLADSVNADKCRVEALILKPTSTSHEHAMLRLVSELTLLLFEIGPKTVVMVLYSKMLLAVPCRLTPQGR
jgi:hypothetical protein